MYMPFMSSLALAFFIAERMSLSPLFSELSPVNMLSGFSDPCSLIVPERLSTNTEFFSTFCAALPDAIMPMMLIMPITPITMKKPNIPTIVASTFLMKSFISFSFFRV